MLIKMKESKGFTLVELMIVVAIIGILAAVAVPFYQRYVAKSRLSSLVFPAMHSIETNVTTYYSVQGTFGAMSFGAMLNDADVACAAPAWAQPVLTMTIDGTACPKLNAFGGRTLTATASVIGASATISGGKVKWKLGGQLATELGMND